MSAPWLYESYNLGSFAAFRTKIITTATGRQLTCS